MKTMHIKQFVVPLMALLMLGKNAVCQKDLTFDNASKMWQEHSCIFPDKSAYKTEAPDISKLEQCRLLDNRTISDDIDYFIKTGLCQSFYHTTINMCQNKKYQSFIQKCLSPDVLQQRKPFAKKDVCTYAFESKYAEYFNFFKTSDQCQRNCGGNNGLDSMRDVCELFAILIYQYEHEKTCNDIERQTQPGAGNTELVDKSNQAGKNQTSVTQQSPTTLSSSGQTESTSRTQLTSLESANKTEGQEGQDIASTSKALNTAGDNTIPTSTDNETRHSDDTSATKGDDLETSKPIDSFKSTGAINDIKTTGLNNDGSKAEPSTEKFEPPTSLLTSKITLATTKGGETIESTPTQEEEESATIAIQNTLLEKGGDGGNDNEINGQEGSHPSDGQPNENSLDSLDEETLNSDKGSTLDYKIVTGKKQIQDTLAKNNNQDVVYDDTESSPGSGHFLAYFLTAVVICISGYVIYHNKQKILAFIIEGRNNGRGGRQRSKDVKYSQLKSNVEEVMPSLEQTVTGKNFVY